MTETTETTLKETLEAELKRVFRNKEPIYSPRMNFSNFMASIEAPMFSFAFKTDEENIYWKEIPQKLNPNFQ